MGVLGLQTYLREHRRHLSQQHSLPSSPSPRIVVDGWSFIYNAQFTSGIPWVYGGEYHEFHDTVQSIVTALLHMCHEVHFVFDGPYPPPKFATGTSRLEHSAIKPALLFFRTSTTSRSKAGFLNENRILPPLVLSACLLALRTLQSQHLNLSIHFADEEGDPYAVELAGRIGGFVLGADSDFVIFNTPGYQGYIPFEELEWSTRIQKIDQPPSTGEDEDFQPVSRGKAKQKTANTSLYPGLIPPMCDPQDLILSFSVFPPKLLASYIKLPQSLLPLLGALLGNDYSSHGSNLRLNPQKLLYTSRSTTSNRIARTSEVIQSLLTSHRRKPSKPINSVINLIEQTVASLASTSPIPLASGEIDGIVDRIVEGTLKYAIPTLDPPIEDIWPSEACLLHPPEQCKLLPDLSRKVDEAELVGSDEDVLRAAAIRNTYLSAYREGEFSPRLMDVLHTATFWPRLFLESPDSESASISLGRQLRQWCYAILHDAVGLSPPIEEEEDEKRTDPDVDSDDELVDVVSDSESGDEPLSNVEDDDGNSVGDSLSNSFASQNKLASLSSSPLPPKEVLVTEYVRRGSRISQERVQVPLLAEILPHHLQSALETPIVLAPTDVRLSLLLHILNSDTPSIRSLSPKSLLPVLAVRWCLSTLGTEVAAHPDNREKQKSRWTRHEAASVLGSFTHDSSSSSDDNENLDEMSPPEVLDRNVQLLAQFESAVEAIRHLIQTLLLHTFIPSPINLFSGMRCHAYLTRSRSLPNSDNRIAAGGNEEFHVLCGAVEEGFSEYFGEEVQKRKKIKGQKPSTINQNQNHSVLAVNKGKEKKSGGKPLLPGQGSLFALLDTESSA